MQANRRVIILADGGIDLPEGFAAAHEVQVVPLMLHFGSEMLRSGVDIAAVEFYDRLRACGMNNLPTTSQPSAGDYLSVYQDLIGAGLPILSFHLSGSLSGSVASARIARDMLPNQDIRIIDTGTLSAAMGMQVMVAAKMALSGAGPEEIIAEAARIGRETELYYTIDKLDYLRHGGRIGKVAGYVGSLLGIRPIITVEKSTGAYVATGRARSFRLAVGKVLDTMAEKLGEGAAVSCLVVHGDCLAEAERFMEAIQARFRCQSMELVRANPSLGVHVGPDTLGIAWYPGALFAPALVD